MRIRKHAKIPLFSTTVLEAYVCQLNQSPWDVMNFSPPSTPPSPPPPSSQVNGIGTSAINDSSKASISVIEWEESDNVSDRKWDCTDGSDAAEKSEGAVVFCCKTDGKSWQCHREASNGNSMCEDHLSVARNYNYNSVAQSCNKKKATVVAEGAKRRPGPKKASSSSSNPYEFYYYSGFGPRWGKKRGEDNKDNVCKTTLSQFIDEDLDYIKDEDAEEELYERKRARKPVKARSLKSLM